MAKAHEVMPEETSPFHLSANNAEALKRTQRALEKAKVLIKKCGYDEDTYPFQEIEKPLS